jgi:Raf kinase inhibitor-like YbhB/YbcL family protein
MSFSLTSTAFADGNTIPDRYARAGDNVLPPLEWTEPPEEAASFALIVDDPDAPDGTFTHGAILNIPSDRTTLEEGIDTQRQGDAFTYGTNSFGNAKWDGPEPPRGHGLHHYHFHLLALDVGHLDLEPEAEPEEVWDAVRGHTLDEAELVGTYERR